jgi:hypothetical protein
MSEADIAPPAAAPTAPDGWVWTLVRPDAPYEDFEAPPVAAPEAPEGWEWRLGPLF